MVRDPMKEKESKRRSAGLAPSVLGAVFGAVARLDAELAAGSFELESSRARLESYVTATCGDSATGLFDVMSGAGTLSGV